VNHPTTIVCTGPVYDVEDRYPDYDDEHTCSQPFPYCWLLPPDARVAKCGRRVVTTTGETVREVA
jgi:hypothetical protein